VMTQPKYGSLIGAVIIIYYPLQYTFLFCFQFFSCQISTPSLYIPYVVSSKPSLKQAVYPYSTLAFHFFLSTRSFHFYLLIFPISLFPALFPSTCSLYTLFPSFSFTVFFPTCSFILFPFHFILSTFSPQPQLFLRCCASYFRSL